MLLNLVQHFVPFGHRLLLTILSLYSRSPLLILLCCSFYRHITFTPSLFRLNFHPFPLNHFHPRKSPCLLATRALKKHPNIPRNGSQTDQKIAHGFPTLSHRKRHQRPKDNGHSSVSGRHRRMKTL